jgi:hypothetical protein
LYSAGSERQLGGDIKPRVPLLADWQDNEVAEPKDTSTGRRATGYILAVIDTLQKNA